MIKFEGRRPSRNPERKGVPPAAVAHLVSRNFVRSRLREVTAAHEVSEAAVDAIVNELKAIFTDILERVATRVSRERELRRVHGVYPEPVVREDHVTPVDNVKRLRRIPGHDAGTFAAQGVDSDKNEAEVA